MRWAFGDRRLTLTCAVIVLLAGCASRLPDVGTQYIPPVSAATSAPVYSAPSSYVPAPSDPIQQSPLSTPPLEATTTAQTPELPPAPQQAPTPDFAYGAPGTDAAMAYSGPCACPNDLDSAGRRCGRRSAYSRPGGASPACTSDGYRVAVQAPSYATGGYATGYGAISSVTGLPRTSYVHGYYRKNGTYVRPYYRSRRR